DAEVGPPKGFAPPTRRSLEDAEDECRHCAADDQGAAPVQWLGVGIPRTANGQGQDEDGQGSTRECPEDGMPRPEIQQTTGSEHPDDGARSGDTGPDANCLVPLLL